MDIIIKLLRRSFFYLLSFTLCMFVINFIFENWQRDIKLLFCLFATLALIWWREKRQIPNEIKKVMNHEEDDNASFRDTDAQDALSEDFWVPSNRSATVAGRAIGGMVYVGSPPMLDRDGQEEECRSLIDPSLPVARTGNDKIGIGMLIQKGYSDMPPESRATYLEWLASGRSDESYNAEYMLLYFYGLERRYFLDNPSVAEEQEIFYEVKRLASLYRDNEDALYELAGFIQVARIGMEDVTLYEPVFEFSRSGVPLELKLAIGGRVARGDLLSAKWLMSWLHCDPAGLAVFPSDLIFEEFRILFDIRFEERFPNGLKVDKPSETLRIPYKAASGEFQLDIIPEFDGKRLPDISELREPLEIAQEIAEEAGADLHQYLRFIVRNPYSGTSSEALALLPRELWPLFASRELIRLKGWADDIVRRGGLVPVGEVIARIEGKTLDKLTKRKLTKAADSLAQIGFGFTPDPRFALRSPKLGEPAMIFDLGRTVVQLEDVSETYRNALVNIASGAFVAHADGEITENERKTLLELVRDTKKLSDQERRRLTADLEWMLSVAPAVALLRRKLKGTGPEVVATIRTTLISVAHAGGVVRVDDVAAVEKIYKALGLNPSLVYSDLHAGEFRDGLVEARSAKPTLSGKAIPAENSTEGIELDTNQITQIHSETARASSVLGDVFDDAETEGGAEDEAMQETLFPGLEPIRAAFVKEIVKKEHWTEDEFRDLCAQFSLLASGALEDINEWVFENFGDALLDEHDGFEINSDTADALRKRCNDKDGGVEAGTRKRDKINRVQQASS